MLRAADPVRAFLCAHEVGEPVALATAGTSGSPRAIVRSTASWVDSFPHVSALTGLSRGSRLWVPGPLSATMNLFAAVHGEYVGARRTGSLQDATHAFLTPSQLRRALDRPDALRGVHVVVAGDRLERGLQQQALRSGAQVNHYYGAAELSFVGWGSHAEDLRAFPGVAVAIRHGVVWVRSPYLCLGYQGAPGPLTRDGDGFATVGDRGTFEHGRLRVDGRGEDAVVTGGVTVLVADVEPFLRSAAGGEVVVLGVPHGELGAVLAAVLTDASAQAAVRGAARDRLAATHRPRLWFAVPELPVTDAGKLDRTRLREMLVSSAPGVRRLP